MFLQPVYSNMITSPFVFINNPPFTCCGSRTSRPNVRLLEVNDRQKKESAVFVCDCVCVFSDQETPAVQLTQTTNPGSFVK